MLHKMLPTIPLHFFSHHRCSQLLHWFSLVRFTVAGSRSPPGDYCQIIPSKPSKHHRSVPPFLPAQLLQIVLNQEVPKHVGISSAFLLMLLVFFCYAVLFFCSMNQRLRKLYLSSYVDCTFTKMSRIENKLADNSKLFKIHRYILDVNGEKTDVGGLWYGSNRHQQWALYNSLNQIKAKWLHMDEMHQWTLYTNQYRMIPLTIPIVSWNSPHRHLAIKGRLWGTWSQLW